jgi:PadR family transcriptional regulator, regulatory protein PadR
MAREDSERILLPQGVLELLILRTLARGEQHGYAIALAVQRASSDALGVEEGSLYPALHRLERRGWARARWGVTDSGRRARFYGLSAAGKKRLASERKSWERMTRAVELVLRERGAGA